MADLLTEADDLLRQERMQKIWDEYNTPIIVFILFILLATGCFSGYTSWNKNVQERQTKTVLSIIDQDISQSETNEDKVEQLRSDIRAVLYLSQTGTFINRQNKEKALETLSKIKSDQSASKEFLHLSEISYNLISDNNNMSTNTNIKNNSFFYDLSNFYLSFFKGSVQNDYIQAKSYLDILRTKPGMPETIYNKAEVLSHMYALKEKRTQETQ